jgi:hypothetical protein
MLSVLLKGAVPTMRGISSELIAKFQALHVPGVSGHKGGHREDERPLVGVPAHHIWNEIYVSRRILQEAL